jgi:hypothetical protein
VNALPSLMSHRNFYGLPDCASDEKRNCVSDEMRDVGGNVSVEIHRASGDGQNIRCVLRDVEIAPDRWDDNEEGYVTVVFLNERREVTSRTQPNVSVLRGNSRGLDVAMRCPGDVVMARGDVVVARGDVVMARGDGTMALGDGAMAHHDVMLPDDVMALCEMTCLARQENRALALRKNQAGMHNGLYDLL